MYVFLRLRGLGGSHVCRCVSGNIDRSAILGVHSDARINIIALGAEFRAKE